MKEIKLAIIGVGEAAQNFHLPIYYKLPNVILEGVYDRMPTKAKAIADKFEINKVYNNIDDLLANAEITAVDICTTTDTHIDFAIKAIERGKSVLIEKPIAKNYEEAKRIYDAAKKNNTKVMVATNQRFRYDAMVLKNFVQTKELGEIFYVKGAWHQQKRGKEWRQQIERSGGGVLIDLGVSLIDSLLWICDFPKVSSVNASIFKQTTENVEDVCIANIKFESGMIANLEMSWSLFGSKNVFSFDIYGSNGSAKINPLQLNKKDDDVISPISSIDSLSNIAIHKKSFESQLKHFINGALGHQPIISTAEEAVETMKIIDMLYKSAHENRPIMYDEY